MSVRQENLTYYGQEPIQMRGYLIILQSPVELY
ncbi:protein of unknown function [Acidithiobacillus ferrivorans]|uniref:Uncharacterized protein n=1 Tax=Acidithiobacillus ferrivorans TaxID=160808 RepID=A0A060UTT0_9PROT|nr:hypothetical protein AFERRI_600046 [Acidithiobacillus ferrivorans]SMH65376.1 protein of unknown function [Acidithiobacillus ferrivorans]